MNRIIRDVVILFAFCGAFYLLTLIVRGNESDGSSKSNFSKDRATADNFRDRQNWQNAIECYQQMVADDPFNGLAQHRLCEANIQLLCESFPRRRENLKDLSPESKDALEQDRRIQTLQSIKFLNRLTEFPRYRSQAYRTLVFLHCDINQPQEALENYRTFLLKYPSASRSIAAKALELTRTIRPVGSNSTVQKTLADQLEFRLLFNNVELKNFHQYNLW